MIAACCKLIEKNENVAISMEIWQFARTIMNTSEWVSSSLLDLFLILWNTMQYVLVQFPYCLETGVGAGRRALIL